MINSVSIILNAGPLLQCNSIYIVVVLVTSNTVILTNMMQWQKYLKLLLISLLERKQKKHISKMLDYLFTVQQTPYLPKDFNIECLSKEAKQHLSYYLCRPSQLTLKSL